MPLFSAGCVVNDKINNEMKSNHLNKLAEKPNNVIEQENHKHRNDSEPFEAIQKREALNAKNAQISQLILRDLTYEFRLISRQAQYFYLSSSQFARFFFGKIAQRYFICNLADKPTSAKINLDEYNPILKSNVQCN